MREPQVSVVIPHYKDIEGLAKCLAALERQTLARDRFEIIVADNGSPVEPAVLAATIAGRATLVTVLERGAGPARNGGVSASRGKVLAFTDSDCVPSPEWLEEGLDALSGSDIVGGRVRVSVQHEDRITPTEAFERVFAFNFKDYIEKKGFTGSGNLFVSRRVFDRVGGFRSAVSEDVDWSHRATALGYRISYAERAVVFHPARRSWAELEAKWRRVNREMYALHGRSLTGRAKWLFKSLLLPASAIAHSPRVLLTDSLRSPRDRMGALAVLYRSRFWRLADALRIALTRQAH